MFHPPRLKFKTEEIEFRHREQVKLALALHCSGLRDTLTVPSDPERYRGVLQQWTDYSEQLKRTFQDEAAQRTPDEDQTEGAVKILLRRGCGA